MARARNIKPSFFQDDKLGELPIYSRMAFIGLWTLADFRGCLEFRPKMLKVQLLPYDECNIEDVINALEQARFIRYYSVQGKQYIKIVNFEKHQNPHKNERDAGSEIPDISDRDLNEQQNNELHQDGTKPDLIGTARADSLIPSLLIPDSLIPSCSVRASIPKPPKRATQIPEDFYPNETGVSYCEDKKLYLAVELESFRNWHVSKGSVFKDWQACWRTWCDKAVSFGRAGKPVRGGAQSQDEKARTKELARARLFGGQENAAA